MSYSTRKMLATPIHDQAWILTENGNRLGLLTKSEHEYHVLLKGVRQIVGSLDQVQQELNAKIRFEQMVQKSESTTSQQIEHLPIKHDQFHNVQMHPVISYTKHAQSDVRFAAGYWALLFSTGWSGSLSPKLSTLSEYHHVGPFASKLEMNTILAQKNQEFHKGKS